MDIFYSFELAIFFNFVHSNSYVDWSYFPDAPYALHMRSLCACNARNALDMHVQKCLKTKIG